MVRQLNRCFIMTHGKRLSFLSTLPSGHTTRHHHTPHATRHTRHTCHTPHTTHHTCHTHHIHHTPHTISAHTRSHMHTHSIPSNHYPQTPQIHSLSHNQVVIGAQLMIFWQLPSLLIFCCLVGAGRCREACVEGHSSSLLHDIFPPIPVSLLSIPGTVPCRMVLQDQMI